MKIVKKRFKSIKERGDKLLALLLQTNKNQPGDVLELIGTLQFSQQVSLLFLNTRGKDRPTLNDEGSKFVHQFSAIEEIVSIIIKSSKFTAVFAGWHLRSKIDQLTAQFYRDLHLLNKSLESKRYFTYIVSF